MRLKIPYAWDIAYWHGASATHDGFRRPLLHTYFVRCLHRRERDGVTSALARYRLP